MPEDFEARAIGLNRSYDPRDPSTKNLLDYINLKLDSRGFQIVGDPKDYPFLEVAHGLIANFRQKLTLLADHLCPVDQRIHDWLAHYLAAVPEEILPQRRGSPPAAASYSRAARHFTPPLATR